MKIGILVSNVGNFGKLKFYNSQEVGLAKALSKYYSVTVYKLVDEDYESVHQLDYDFDLKPIKAKHIGNNGLVDVLKLNSDLDMLIYFSDTQISVPRVYSWCVNNSIVFVPYIGALESSSDNIFKRFIINILAIRNIFVYKRCICLAKSKYIFEWLCRLGAKVLLMPVGLDKDLLCTEFEGYDRGTLRLEEGLSDEDKVLLLVGRLEANRNSIDIVQSFIELSKMNARYKLIIIGKGQQQQSILSAFDKVGLRDRVIYYEQVHNDRMWKYYRCADAYINLNRNEIFGMSLLEAMYYKTKCVAMNAPGPRDIIENNKNGYLCGSLSELIERVHSDENLSAIQNAAHETVVNKFMWNKASEIIERLYENH